jgi:hypothetical protein
MAREEQAPIREELAAVREALGELRQLLVGPNVSVPAEREDRSEWIGRRMEAKRAAEFIDKHFTRSEINKRLGSRRTTIHRWRTGATRQTKVEDAEKLVRDLGGDPTDFRDELPGPEADDAGEAGPGGDRVTRPTPAEIDAARTPRGSWTKAQLAEWGVPWPPPRGWRKRLLAAAEQPAGDPEQKRVKVGPYMAGERHRCWPEWTWDGSAFVCTSTPGDAR